MITWDSKTLYGKPEAGVCAITGEYETGRWYRRDGKPVFVGNSAAPDAVEDYVAFLTLLGQVNAYKRGYPKAAWTAERVESKKKPARKA